MAEELSDSWVCLVNSFRTLLSQPNCTHTLSSMNSDLLFIILSLLPTETLRVKTVCRAWAQVISDPIFIHLHSSRPAQITAFFTEKHTTSFIPLHTCPKFPSMIRVFLSNRFRAKSTSHGLVCFYRHEDDVIVVANPATSHWARIDVADRTSLELLLGSYWETSIYPLLIYDPTMSFHFKLAIATCTTYEEHVDCEFMFQIYSSETSSWTVSSLCPLEPEEDIIGQLPFDMGSCIESRIGGGSVCWTFYHEYMRVYEIASDTYWVTPLPSEWGYLMGRDGEIYYASFANKKVEVRRLNENKRWILEVEGNTDQLEEYLPFLSSRTYYDPVRRALILAICETNELVAFYLSNSTIEVLSQHECWSDWSMLPHGHTLAPFHGGKQYPDWLPSVVVSKIQIGLIDCFL